MLDHFSRSKLIGPTTGELRLATRFYKALERLCVDLDVPMYLNSTCQSPDHKLLADGCPRSLHQTTTKNQGAGFGRGTGAFVKLF